MSGGTSLALTRRTRDPQFAERYFVGDAIDIGCGPDSIGRQGWPNIRSVMDWDLPHGDATFMRGVRREAFDLVYSSHCLEHLDDPDTALRNWWSLVKPSGHLVLVVPDEDLYEQGLFPSTSNPDHKSTWTLYKALSWSPASRSLLPMLLALPHARVVQAAWIEEGFEYSLDRCDQTALGLAECCIECIVRKENPTT